MKVKHYLKIIALSIFMAVTIPVQTYASAHSITATADPVKDAQTLANITKRVTEIQNMDKTNLTNTEKKSLRKELMGMNKQASGLDKRVYLSVGAIIIIILLLILILN
jgi:hypothetical protein